MEMLLEKGLLEEEELEEPYGKNYDKKIKAVLLTGNTLLQ